MSKQKKSRRSTKQTSSTAKKPARRATSANHEWVFWVVIALLLIAAGYCGGSFYGLYRQKVASIPLEVRLQMAS